MKQQITIKEYDSTGKLKTVVVKEVEKVGAGRIEREKERKV